MISFDLVIRDEPGEGERYGSPLAELHVKHDGSVIWPLYQEILATLMRPTYVVTTETST